MAIMLPTLQRVNKQAKAVACQANLRQWGTILVTAMTADNYGHSPGWGPEYPAAEAWPDWPAWPGWGWGWWWGWGWYGHYVNRDLYNQTEGIRCCPMATKPADPTGQGNPAGGTFLAWGRFRPKEHTEPYDTYGSYGSNHFAWWPYWWRRYQPPHPYYWRSPFVKGANSIPMHLDTCWPWAWLDDAQPPPECDAVPTAAVRQPANSRHSACINRHDGYVNCLLLDWSVRKIGLKELWTLKWHRQFDTAGPWTKAGGVKPEDWPDWMRRLKDY